MTRLLRAEALRLATTRTYWLLAAGVAALIAAGTAATAGATSFTGGVSPGRSVLAIAGLAQTVALVAGALSVTGEFRHKTITPAVLITPRRTLLLAAKLIIMAAAGLTFGLAATGLATAIALPLLAGPHDRLPRHRAAARPGGRHRYPGRVRRCRSVRWSRTAAAARHHRLTRRLGGRVSPGVRGGGRANCQRCRIPAGPFRLCPDSRRTRWRGSRTMVPGCARALCGHGNCAPPPGS